MTSNINDEVDYFKRNYKKKMIKIENDINIYLPFTVMSEILTSTQNHCTSRPVKALDKKILVVKFFNVFDKKILTPNKNRMRIKLISDFDGSELKKLVARKGKNVENSMREKKYKMNQIIPQKELDVINENLEEEKEIDFEKSAKISKQKRPKKNLFQLNQEKFINEITEEDIDKILSSNRQLIYNKVETKIERTTKQDKGNFFI